MRHVSRAFPFMCKHRAAEKRSDLSRLVAQRNVRGSFCGSERGKLFRKKNRHTCGSGSSSQPARQKNGNLRGRTVGDRLKCGIAGVLVAVRIIAAGALKS